MRRCLNSIMNVTVLFFAIFLSVKSEASLLIEPHLDYNLAGGTTRNAVIYKYSGAQYGARLGVQYFGLMGGLAYNLSNYTLKETPVVANSDIKQTELGFFVGYSAPVLLRAWLGYYTSSKQTFTNNDYRSGHTTEFGVGFTGFPFISINLMYRMLSLDNSYLASNATSSAITPAYAPSEIVLGVSLPLTFL